MSVRILQGDCRSVLATLPDASVHCCVTSPPYFGLRDYQTATWDGGDPACDHLRPAAHGYAPAETSTLGPKRDGCGDDNKAHSDGVKRQQYAGACPKCGARRIDAQIGLESSPADYIAEMVAVFREVRRVLRDDGVMFLNLGDGYCSTAPGTLGDQLNQRGILSGVSDRRAAAARKFRPETPAGLKPKDLMMMPARVALALQADGWWLRSDIIWHKPNPMPESCLDRPTSAHEHIFLLTKSSRYFYDDVAVREAIKESSIARLTQPNVLTQPGGPKDTGEGNRSHRRALRNQAEKLIKHEKWKDRFEGWAEFDTAQGRNLRNVWEIATAPFPDAHFATFPPELAERCIKAGTSERGCCAKCGAPWARQIERAKKASDRLARGKALSSPRQDGNSWNENDGRGFIPTEVSTIGWLASCQCNAAVVPCIVLDPFAGAFTAPMVADRLQRNAIGIELSEAYCEMARNRLVRDAGMFAEIAAE